MEDPPNSRPLFSTELPSPPPWSASALVRAQVAFQSPSSMEVTISLPHAGQVTGMGMKKGVTVIVGGGFHGKSTLA